MAIENRLDRLLAYLEGNSSLGEEDKAHFNYLLEYLEMEPHKETVIQVLKSKAFSEEKFIHTTGQKGDPSIYRFEEFFLEVVRAIDEHSREIAVCLSGGSKMENAKEEYPSPDVLAQKFEDILKDYCALEDDLRQSNLISLGIFDKIRNNLEKGFNDLKARLERKHLHSLKKKHWDKTKNFPKHLIENLGKIIEGHGRLTKSGRARVIAKMLAPFRLNLKESTIRKSLQNFSET